MSRHELIALDSLEARPWKNGAGLTRELAIGPAHAGMDDFDWRISLAEVARDAPFSAFPGIERCIVLLQGGGMRLRSTDGRLDHRLDQAFKPFRFAGDMALNAQMLDGPSTDFNVMVRRTRFTAELRSCHDTQRVDPGAVALVLCWQGHAAIDGDAAPLTLHERQALLWRNGSPALQVHPASANSRILLVQLQALHQDSRP